MAYCRPEMQVRQGVEIELRRPDGTVVCTTAEAVLEMPNNFAIVLPGLLDHADVPRGTEVWVGPCLSAL